jgi:hypothetical protein
MDSNTTVAIMFISAFSAMSLIFNFLLSYRLKSKMLRSGLMDLETLKLIDQINVDSRRNVLKWILLLFFGGLGLIVLQYTRYQLNEPLPYGIEALFIATGLFIYYLMILRKNNTQ